MGNKVSLEDQMVNLKLSSKQMIRASQKCEKGEAAQKLKLKKAIEQGNYEGAKIYAQNAIREKNQALNYLRLSSRIDAVASRLETAIRMNQVTSTMSGIVEGMDRALEAMDIETISRIMDKFEKQFEDMDVRAGYMEGTMASSTAMSSPQEEVDMLIQQTADEHQIQLGGEFASVPTGIRAEEKPAEVPNDSLEARLAALRK